MPRPSIPARVTPRAARVGVPALPCLLLQLFQAVVVHQVHAGASVASLPWHGTRVACASPHESLGAHAPSHVVPAGNAGVLVVRSVAVRQRCVPLAVLLISLSRRLPAACGFRARRRAGGQPVRSFALSLAGRAAFPWPASVGRRASVPFIWLVLVLPVRPLGTLACALHVPWVRQAVLAAFPFRARLVLAWIHFSQA